MINLQEQKNFEKVNKIFSKIPENSHRSSSGSVEYVKKLKNVSFGIIKENSFYTIKISNKKNDVLLSEDFNYINGYEDRKRFQRKTLQEAIKYLHLVLNEDKYVLDVPVPSQPENVEPEPEISPMDNPQEPELDIDQNEMDGENEMEDTGDEDQNLDDVEDDGKEIQQLSGKLSQIIRQQIDAGEESLTVGAIKSILSSGKKLSTDSKEEVLKKAENVLKSEDEETPENNIEEGYEIERIESDTEEIDKAIKNANLPTPKTEINRLVSKYSILPNCEKYERYFPNHGRFGGVRFITNGKYDLFVFYFHTVEKENYDIFIVEKNKVDYFLKDVQRSKNQGVPKFISLDKDFHEIDDKIRKFLTDKNAPNKGGFNVHDKNIEESHFLTKKQIFESLERYKRTITENVNKWVIQNISLYSKNYSDYVDNNSIKTDLYGAEDKEITTWELNIPIEIFDGNDEDNLVEIINHLDLPYMKYTDNSGSFVKCQLDREITRKPSFYNVKLKLTVVLK